MKLMLVPTVLLLLRCSAQPVLSETTTNISSLWPKPTNWMIPAKYLDFYIEKILEYEMKFKKYYSHGAVCPKLLTIFDSIVNYYRRIQFLIKCKNQKCIRIWKNGVHKQETTPTLSFIFSDQNMAILERRSPTEIK